MISDPKHGPHIAVALWDSTDYPDMYKSSKLCLLSEPDLTEISFRGARKDSWNLRGRVQNKGDRRVREIHAEARNVHHGHKVQLRQEKYAMTNCSP